MESGITVVAGNEIILLMRSWSGPGWQSSVDPHRAQLVRLLPLDEVDHKVPVPTVEYLRMLLCIPPAASVTLRWCCLLLYDAENETTGTSGMTRKLIGRQIYAA